MERDTPVTVFDVAAYILEVKQNPMTSWKLQKLVYYCQVWSLVWDETPLFHEEIYAWANGPAIQELYEHHRGEFHVKELKIGASSHLSMNQKDTIDQVLKAYGDKTAQWLSDLSHLESPWIEARRNLQPGERGEVVIPLAALHEYYSSIHQKFAVK